MRNITQSIRPAAWLGALALLLAGWASAGDLPASGPAPETAAETAGVADRLTIETVSLVQGEGEAELSIAARGSLVWTTYRNAEDDLVVELPGSVASEAVADLYAAEGLVESVTVDRADGVTRLVIATRLEAEHSVAAEGSLLTLQLFPAGAATAAAPEPPAVEAEAEPAASVVAFEAPAAEPPAYEPEPAQPIAAPVVAAVPEPSAPAIAAPVVTETSAPADAPEPLETHTPVGVAATQLHEVAVERTDGTTTVRMFGDGEFYYSTFRLDDPARFVVDLIGVANLAPQASYRGSGEVVGRVRVAQFRPQPEMVSRVVVDLIEQATPELTVLPDGLLLTFGGAGAPASTLWQDEPAEPGGIEQEAVAALQEESVMEEPPAAPPVPALPPLREPLAAPAAAPSTSSAGVALATEAGEPTAGFLSRDVTPGDRKYYGEPMTISLKDADIKDLLRTFHEISGLNIIVQPGVRGTVTVEFVDVPWDQALDQILKINGLGYQIEGNVMRVAPTATLREEAEEEQRLRTAQAQAVPLTTIMKRVSYATARDVASTLRSGDNSVLSQRGTVIVDERTNTLIITELPVYIDSVIAVIENLDIPEPQVMIEARIVETTKRFTRALGIQWGFDAIASAATGNTTGLVFPNNGAVVGDVTLGQPGLGTLGVTMGNVLNTFNLDIALQAAETEGLVNILSAPKITTLNNEPASIQSGLQIPIQTVANNTVSVQFVNATLRLSVTPHVTAEGTVLLDIDIQKREPLLAFAQQGASNAPISTKDASTRVIVRDGGTTVIGGIYEVTSDEGEDRVPGLGRVPILKHLFKNNRQSEENEELLIFITPRIVRM